MSRRITSPVEWHRLDNAGRVFAALASRRNTVVFRIAATLNEAVDLGTLQSTVDRVMPRFPQYRVRLRTGLFWHYFQDIEGSPTVQPEREAPCRRMCRRRDGPWQIRVLVHGRRIALECSHALTDGASAMVFLTALLADYLARRGGGVAGDDRVPRATDPPSAQEWEDAYGRFYNPRVPRPSTGRRAFRLKGVPLHPDEMRVTLGVVPFAPLQAMARHHGVTLTELLASVLIESVADIAGRTRRPLTVMVPVNLRRFFPTLSMRNFFLSITASIDPRLGAYTLEEVLHEVHHSMQRQVSAKSISRQIRRHVGAERNTIIRHIPLVLKVPVKRLLYRLSWGARYTTALSNLGRVDLPEAMMEQIERIEVIANPSAAHGVGSAVVGFGENLYINFGSIRMQTGLERAFFTRLRRMGVPVRIETN